MIRDDARATIWRFREVLLGAALILLALWLYPRFFGLMQFLLLIPGGLGVFLVITGIQRARLPAGAGDGPGVVEVDERQISYLSAQGGGAVSLDDMQRIHIQVMGSDAFGAPFYWHFVDLNGRLTIPSNAAGVDLIHDAISPLQGVHYDGIIRAATAGDPQDIVIWAPERRKLH